MLIYGENGSGKSSIYKALKDFFESSDNPTLNFGEHLYTRGLDIGSVKVTFSEFPETNQAIVDDIFDFNIVAASRTANTSSYIKKANKARAFLSYQELVKSYLTEKDEKGNPNLYSYFIDTLLAEHVFIGPNFTGQTIKSKWTTIQKGVDKDDARLSEFWQAEADIRQ